MKHNTQVIITFYLGRKIRKTQTSNGIATCEEGWSARDVDKIDLEYLCCLGTYSCVNIGVITGVSSVFLRYRHEFLDNNIDTYTTINRR